MAELHPEQRKLLESVVLQARKEAEKAASAALVALAVQQEEAYPSLSESQRLLRRKLRVEARRLGDPLEKAAKGVDPFPALSAEVAYEQWHRLLFARFLAANRLLIHPELHAPVSLQDCAEIAHEEGKPDAWTVACEYAAAMLPGIFRNDDPMLQVRFDAAGSSTLEKLLQKLPETVFLADDSLGWVYQFWQAEKKTEVNKSGRKIGGADIAPVTQLFTEHYMVQFLLHNSLGAWWAARHPDESLPTDLDYLRRNEDGTPAAGTFPGWPQTAAELKVLDPCCGSGHFLVAAFALLRRIRMQEEGLTEADAGDAVLRDNLFGLELDPRCTQIAVFAVCLAAWKAGGYRPLPIPNIACCGLAVGDRVFEWTRLAEKEEDPKERDALEATLRRLWHLFRDAPDLGSLIDPTRIAAEEHLFAVDWNKIAPLLEKALAKEREQDDPAAIFGEAAKGVLRAAELLSGKYTLVVTNVPYLGRGNQDKVVREYIEKYHNSAKADLATAFVERCLTFCTPSGSTALVMPQNWLFLGSYKILRERLLKEKTWNVMAFLGPQAFQTPMYDFNVGLFVLTTNVSEPKHCIIGIDASAPRIAAEKAGLLRSGCVYTIAQTGQLLHPDCRITLTDVARTALLETLANSHQGLCTGDNMQFCRQFWEFPNAYSGWEMFQSSPDRNSEFSGMEQVFRWEDGKGRFYAYVESLDGRLGGSWFRGTEVWGKKGIVVSQTGTLTTCIYTGAMYQHGTAVIVPHKEEHLPAIWAYCSSQQYRDAVRKIDQKVGVTGATLVKVPFDLRHWQKIAEEKYPNGLPEPHSDDPTQWLFHGQPAHSTDPLQVAMARLLGYRWPEHGLPPTPSGKLRQDEDGLDAFADADGIVCLPSVSGEAPAEQRLLTLLAAAYGPEWSPTTLEDLLAKAGYGGKGLEAWLREGFFKQHCSLFHNRPFLWHIWDGEKDGFSAIVNYHKLDHTNLERLIYFYLGDWVERQRTDDNNGVPGAGRRLKAALDLQVKLKAIAHGEPPHDIYVRWKPLHQQPIGWEPDLNDGVRLNIRPFVTAGVLRSKFTINWNKDRGEDPKPNLSGTTNRLNDLHFTRAEKEAARRSPPSVETVQPIKIPDTLDL